MSGSEAKTSSSAGSATGGDSTPPVDYYAVLDIPTDATKSDIKKASVSLHIRFLNFRRFVFTQLLILSLYEAYTSICANKYYLVTCLLIYLVSLSIRLPFLVDC